MTASLVEAEAEVGAQTDRGGKYIGTTQEIEVESVM